MRILLGKLNYIFIKRFAAILLLIFFSFSTKSQQLVSIQTSQGEIIVKLYEETPIHKANFLKLINKGFYDSTLFHRVIKDFMIQAGDPNSKGASHTKKLGGGGPGYTLESEINNKFIHKKGALAAARQGDNVNPNKRSSGSQFYIVEGRTWPRKYMAKFEEDRGELYKEEQLIAYETLGGTPHLDGQYTVFGEVVSGLNTLEAISNQKTLAGDRPAENIYIIYMKLID